MYSIILLLFLNNFLNGDEWFYYCDQFVFKDQKNISCCYKDNLDIKPLLKLKNLEGLNLTGSKIKDFTPIKKLKQLKYILFIDTNFKNENILSNLVNLEDIYLSGTKIKSINFLKNIKNLRTLYIDNTVVSDISILKKYKKSCDMEFNFTNTNIDYRDINEQFYKVETTNKFIKNVISYTQKAKIIGGHFSFRNISNYWFSKCYDNQKEIERDDLSNLVFRYHIYAIKNRYKSYLRIMYPLRYGENIIYEDENYVKISDISFLIHFKNLKILYINISSNINSDYFKYLNKLERLYLYGNITKLNIIPKSLKELYIFNSNLENYNFLSKSNLNYLRITTKDFNNKKFIKLKNRYPNIKIDVLDPLFYSLLERPILGKDIDYDKVDFTKIDPSKILKGGGIYSYSQIEREFTLKMRKHIKNKDLESIIYYENIKYINYILKNYNFNLNKIDKETKETIQDYAYELKNKEIIKLLRNYGAKRGCELLNKKCERDIF